MEIIAGCPSCGVRFKFTEQHFGLSIPCPKCSCPIHVPSMGPAGEMRPPDVRPPMALLQPVPPVPPLLPPVPEVQRCPSCGTSIPMATEICPRCGYDLAMADLVDSSTAESESKAARGTTVSRRHRHRNRGSNFVWLLTFGAAGVMALIAGSIWIYSAILEEKQGKSTQQSFLMLDWETDDRFTGTVKIDERKLSVPESGELQYAIAPGRHHIVLTRDGFDAVEFDLALGAGERHHYRPSWNLSKPADDPEGSAGPTEAAGARGVVPAGAPMASYDDWLQDFEAARKKAAQESKDVLIVFAGSDWCGWSIRLAYETLMQKEFRSRAEGRYVLMYVDFPRKAQKKAKVQDPARNRQLSQKFHVRGYPEIVVTDPEGYPFGFSGYVEGGPDAFFEMLVGCQLLHSQRDTLFREIEATPGESKVKAIEKAVTFLKQKRLWPYYGPTLEKWSTAALAADPKNESGVPEAIFELSWGLRFLGRDMEQMEPQQVTEIVGELDAWKKARPLKDPDRAAKLHLRAAVALGMTRQPAEATKYVEAALAYQPKDEELREELAGFAAAIRGTGAGTGFAVAAGGLVLTNHHVIEGAKRLQVRLPGRQEPVDARVIADDSRRDLALLKVDLPAGKSLKPLPMAKRTAGRGAKVGAFGFPVTGTAGSGLKLTTGIVSAEPDASTRGMLLLDCRINPGNSGGPLCDVYGNVVGVVTAKSVGGFGVESFGMAQPAEVVQAFLGEKLPAGVKLTPPVRAKKGLEWDEIDGEVNGSVLLILQAQ